MMTIKTELSTDDIIKQRSLTMESTFINQQSTRTTKPLSLSIASILGHVEEKKPSPVNTNKNNKTTLVNNVMIKDKNDASRYKDLIPTKRVSQSDSDGLASDQEMMDDESLSKHDGIEDNDDDDDFEDQRIDAHETDVLNEDHDVTNPTVSGVRSNEAAKQTPSYTAIIAQAILSSSDKKLPLGNIYDYISDNFPEFLKKGQGWRNCVRHNLSLSECFVKAGRARNGRGNYWGIHPRYIKNFSKGDFRKRRASHRPRNRDLTLALGPDRHPYHIPTPFMPPYVLPNVLPRSHPHRSFSVESILSPDRGLPSAFNNYKPWAIGNKDHDGLPYPYRLPAHCTQHSLWVEQKTAAAALHSGHLPSHPALTVVNHSLPFATMERGLRPLEYYSKSHDYSSPPPATPSIGQLKTACSCHMFCCTKS